MFTSSKQLGLTCNKLPLKLVCGYLQLESSTAKEGLCARLLRVVFLSFCLLLTGAYEPLHKQDGASDYLCRITLQNVPYMDFNLIVLTSFDSQEPTNKCRLINKVGVNIQLTLYGAFVGRVPNSTEDRIN